MKSSRQTIFNRRSNLIQLLHQADFLSVSELSSALGISEVTVRRDLDTLEAEGILLRYFGGARLVDTNILKKIPSGELKEKKKIALAKRMAEFIEDNDTIFINSSSTACLIYPFIQAQNITVITNNTNSILQKRNPTTTLLLTGGEVYLNKNSLTGAYALEVIHKVTCTKCIIGVSGISAKGGITSSLLAETSINRAMIQHCKGSVFVVADSSKIGIEQNFYSGSITDINYLITDSDVREDALQEIIQSGLQAIIVNYSRSNTEKEY